jgi:hypothetical protein
VEQREIRQIKPNISKNFAEAIASYEIGNNLKERWDAERLLGTPTFLINRSGGVEFSILRFV